MDVVEAQDPSLRGLTGQHLYLEPQAEVDYAVATHRRGAPYMFPRSDAIVLGLGEGEVVTPEEMLARQRILLPGAGA
jgi:hypothetical protein